MSFPPATEMFQFAGFASTLPSIPLTRWVAPFGDLWINGCSPLPRAYRRVLRPSSPLGAKASTRCPFVCLRAFNPPCASTHPGHDDASQPEHADERKIIRSFTHGRSLAEIRCQTPGVRDEPSTQGNRHPCLLQGKDPFFATQQPNAMATSRHQPYNRWIAQPSSRWIRTDEQCRMS